MNRENQRPVERIVVALDGSPQSLAALRAAAQLAAYLQIELHGLFIEDADLLRLCGLPFGQEIGLLSATARPLERAAVERQLRARATALQQTIAHIANAMRIPWSFQVTRGSVVDELLAAAATAQLISVGPHQRTPGSQMSAATEVVVRQTPRPVLILGSEERLSRPFTLVYNGSEAAERALDFAMRLARHTEQTLQIILAMSRAEAERMIPHISERLAEKRINARFVYGAGPGVPTHLLSTVVIGTLILPAEYADQLSRLKGPLILVP